MTNLQFKAWRKHMGLTIVEAAEALGVSEGSVELYERGARREDGRPVIVPKPVELACAALALGVKAYEGPQEA
jgi:transcriptional regulator with XRE-family HTH domain